MANRKDKATPITYLMNNVVNGEAITLKGNGTLDASGLMEIIIRISKMPAHWSGIIVPCICSGPGPGNGSPDLSKNVGGVSGLIGFAKLGYRTTPGTLRVASLYDDTGALIASVRATGEYLRTPKGLSFSINVDTRTVPGTILPKLNRIDHYSFSMHPAGTGRVEVFAHYSLSSSDGEKAFGWTHIFYDMVNCNIELPHTLIGSNDIDVKVDGQDLRYSSKQSIRSSAMLGAAW